MTRDVALALLGLHESEPTESQINEAYRNAMRMNHPDKYGYDEQLREHAEEQCKLINEAREVLLNRSWDRSGNANWHDAYSRNNTSEQSKADDSSKASTEQEKASQAHAKAQEETRSAQEKPADQAPLLEAWKTSVPFSVLGIICYVLLNSVESSLSYSMPFLIFIEESIRFALQIFYAAYIYPSLFSATPKLRSNTAVAFCNCFFGFFIFGPLWNWNLTKGNKGVSNVVFVLGGIALLVLSTAVFFMWARG